ncbi:MFS transporter [Parasutterella excrementihominis]|uniref:MFS transporter n=2 Tax=Parasutterella TaxID=577310 RepID=UPI002666B565|nr:MFS transporter [Parasutterella excrementihominis]
MPWVVTLTILVASAFLMDMSFTMITPFLPVYLSSELGAKASEVDMWSGAVFAVTFLVSGLLGPVWGVLADRKSRKLMALRASIGLTISYALCGIVQTPTQLFAARLFQGLCAGLYPALLALLAASIPARKTGLSMGLMQGGMTVGAVVGPFVGGVLADYFGMRESFFVASVALGLISLLIGFCIKEKPRTIKVTSRNWFDWSVLRQPAIFKMLIACAVIHASLFSAQPILPLYIAQLQGSMDNIMMLSGTIFSVCAISIMIASPILGAAGQKFGFLKVLSCSLFFAGLLISAQVLGRTPFEFGVWRFIAGFAIAGLIPLVNSIISTECPPDKKGEVFGFNFLTGHAGMALGPFAAGALSGWFGYQAVIVASGLILFPLIVYLNYGRKQQRSLEALDDKVKKETYRKNAEI